MKKKVITLLAALTLTLAACGQQTLTESSAVAGASTDAAAKQSALLQEVTDTEDAGSAKDADITAADGTLTLTDGTDYTIETGGTYVVTGSAQNATIFVDAADTDRVEIILDGAEITNDDLPCIYVKSAEQVTVTMTDTDNALSVTGSFRTDTAEGADGVIFSATDLILAGDGTMTIDSSDKAVSCGRNLTVSGGTYDITAAGDGLYATVTAQIDGGTFTIDATEGIEATVVEINDGSVDITASDDGINASQKDETVSPVLTINGGTITIAMAQGDTDALDSNGDLYITGGTLNITAQSPFDYDGTAEWTGGTITVNGTEVTSLTTQQMGPGGRPDGTFGGPGGGRPDGTFGGPGFGRPDGTFGGPHDNSTQQTTEDSTP